MNLVHRALTEGEFPLFDEISTVPTSGVGRRSRTFAEYAADGDYRPDWVWVSLHGDQVVARASFWGPPGADHPYTVDFFDCDTARTGAELLRAAYDALVPPGYHSPVGPRPEYHLFVPADWREQPAAVADVELRTDAARQAGLRFHVERLNLRWIPEYGLPQRSGRLAFRPVTDDAHLLDVLAAITQGSLDAWDQRELRTRPAREVAAETLNDLAGFPGGRNRWLTAEDGSGAPVGAVLPTRNARSATIGYIGVDPRYRGMGYGFDLLAEAMHRFAVEGVPEINDSTDVGNTPMAAIFEHIGYRVTDRRIIFT